MVLGLGCGPVRSSDSTLVLDDRTPPTNAPTEDVGRSTGAKPEVTGNLSRTEACARFATLADDGCDWTKRHPASFRDPANCESALETWTQQPHLAAVVNCWALECGPARECMVAAAQNQPAAPPRACGFEGTGPVHVDAGTWAARPGANTQRFSELTTTPATPIELCGIEAELAWITQVRCNDGSNPFGSVDRANKTRDAWIERGGRCNSVIDRFTATCPERTYTIFVDRYVCLKRGM